MVKEIKVLGPGCPNCSKLAANVKEAIKISGKNLNFVYETDIHKIIEAGIMITPGLLIDDKVLSSGKVMSVNEILDLINS